MNILIVDDDRDIIEAIINAVDFQSLGIRSVFSANTAEDAKDILNGEEIDLMVTDIEMPNLSGIELLRWVRDEAMPVVTIFCTCYANFDYAKTAIQLGCFDYFLKPIPYDEFTDRLRQAVEEVKRRKNQADYENLEQSPDKIRDIIAADFWDEVINRNQPFMQILEKYHGLDYTQDDRFILALSFVSGNDFHLKEKDIQFCKTMEKRLLEQSPAVQREAIVAIAQKGICGIYKCTGSGAAHELIKVWKELHRRCKEDCGLGINFYYADACAPQDIKPVYTELLSAFLDDVARNYVITGLSGYKLRPDEYTLTQFSYWESLLANEKIDKLISEISGHLDSCKRKGCINDYYLEMLHIDIMQMLHTMLKNFQVRAYALYSDSNFKELEAWSTYSVEKSKAYIRYLLKTAEKMLSMLKNSSSGIDAIKAYIDTHLDEELSRSMLSEIVFLNPDYMARLFKKQVGVSISAYILQERLRKAKGLLLHTHKSINEIAQTVGYNNTSYFSHIFRKAFGLTPNEYRSSNSVS